jgi:antitoxin ParD1/3/4
MADTQIELAEECLRFIDREVIQGRFRSRREVIEAGLLMLEERETRLASLRATIAEVESHRPGARSAS